MDESKLNQLKAGPAETGVHELILKRWSPRALSDAEITSSDLITLFTAASWAASSFNEQPWRFLLGFKGDSTHARIFGTLNDKNKSWANSAPVLFLTVAKQTFTKDGSENFHSVHDTGAASATLALQATALGLYVHGMAGFDRNAAGALFGLPADFEPVAVWALGHLRNNESLPDPLKGLETAARVRRTLTDFVLRDWNTPAELESQS